jgi:hypothetical protein
MPSGTVYVGCACESACVSPSVNPVRLCCIPTVGRICSAYAVCLGMAGSSAPFEKFDPLDFLGGKSANQIKLYRESEVSSNIELMLCYLRWLQGYWIVLQKIGSQYYRSSCPTYYSFRPNAFLLRVYIATLGADRTYG